MIEEAPESLLELSIDPVISMTTAEASSVEFAQRIAEYGPFLLALARLEVSEALRCKLALSDIVQETILKGIEISPRFTDSTQEGLAAWLRAILLRLLSNYRRVYYSQKRDLKLEVPADNQIECRREKKPFEVVLDLEQKRLIEASMLKLPESYREVILMRNRDGATFSEIGIHLQMSEDAARKTWKRAVIQLKQELKPY